MACISFENDSTWVRARWVFTILMDDLVNSFDDENTIAFLEQAKALDGLHFTYLDRKTAKRIKSRIKEITSKVLIDEMTYALNKKRLDNEGLDMYKNSMKELLKL